MSDIVDKATRSRMMSGIKGKNTRNEILVRKALFAKGFRYRINVGDLPGKPDIVLPKYRAVILIHGCFWHQHDCGLFRLPGTNTDFWEKKIGGNKVRDMANRKSLLADGWRIAVVWECALKGRERTCIDEVAGKLETWLSGSQNEIEIKK